MKRSLLIKSSILLYALIGLEIFIMISPFAAYFYSLYSPLLRLLYSSSVTRWMVEFFLPHFVFTNDPFMKVLGVVQFLTFFSGMFLFFFAAIPLYISKFRKKGVLTKGIYCKTRHPQYIGLGIAGFGLLLYWPRFIILIMYISMLFIYYLLADHEEQLLLRSHPEAYRKYMDAVPRFLPGSIGKRIFSSVFGRIRSRGSALGLLYCGSLVLAIGVAFALRIYSVQIIDLEMVNNIAGISALPAPSGKIKQDLKVALNHPACAWAAGEKKPSLAYVLPSDYFLMAILTDIERLYPPGFETSVRGNFITRFFRIFLNYTKMQLGIYPERHPFKRIIFVKVTADDGRLLRGKDVFMPGAIRYPVFHVDIDEAEQKVLSVEDLQPKHKWGTIAMPVF